MQFLVELLRILHADKNASVSTAANAAYEKVLQPYHGWLTSGVFWGALKLVPTRESLFQKLGESSSLEEDMGSFVSQFDAVLSKIHTYMVSLDAHTPSLREVFFSSLVLLLAGFIRLHKTDKTFHFDLIFRIRTGWTFLTRYKILFGDKGLNLCLYYFPPFLIHVIYKSS